MTVSPQEYFKAKIFHCKSGRTLNTPLLTPPPSSPSLAQVIDPLIRQGIIKLKEAAREWLRDEARKKRRVLRPMDFER